MDDISEQRGNFLAEAPSVLKLCRRALGHACFAVPGRQLDHEKKMWKYFAGKNWDSSLESGKQREYFYIRGNRKHEYSPWGLDYGEKGSSILVTQTEHNSVLRPVYNLEQLREHPVLVVKCTINGTVTEEPWKQQYDRTAVC